MDTLWSCFQQSIAARYSNDLNDLENQYRCYRQFMQLWESTQPPMIHVAYEQMVSDYSNTLKRVISDMGLVWDERCLDRSSAHSAITTASRMQVRKPIHTGSIGAWQRYEKHLAPLRARLDEFYGTSNDTATS